MKKIIFIFLASSVFLYPFFTFGQSEVESEKSEPLIMVRDNNKLNINMEEVELKEFIRAMSGILNKNFVISSKLKGKVNIISPLPVSKDLAYSLLESVLDVHGYQIVQADSLLKIIDTKKTKTEGLDTRYGLNIEPQLSADKMITQVLPLKYINAIEILNMFKPLVAKDGYLVIHEPSNTVILTDKVSNVNRFKKIIKNIDVKGTKSQIYHFRLEYADVEQLVQELTPLFQKSGSPTSRATPGKSKSLPLPRFTVPGQQGGFLVADKRTNTLLALCTAEEYVQVEHLVNLLDIPTTRVRDRIHVYYLNNAVAEDLAEVLNKQSTKQKGAPKRPGQPQVEGLLEDVTINADKATNSLVITASPEDFDILFKVIEKLDVRRAQVLVEALIVETTLDKTSELGIEWRNMDAPDPDSITAFGGTNLPVGTQSTGALNTAASNANPYSSSNPAGLVVGAIKGPIYWGEQVFYSVGALARALQADSDVNILLTPHILTYDNEESEIIVGEERPYLKSSQTSTEGSIIRTFEFKDVGTTLRLTPHISQGDIIRLQIFTEIKNFVEQVDIGAITTTKRQVKTSVQVEDGRTVVLGGLIKEDTRKSRSMVPCLGQIWGLGWLFKSQKGQDQKTNLLIFITPNIVKSGEDLQKITDKKKTQYNERVEESSLNEAIFSNGEQLEIDAETKTSPQENGQSSSSDDAQSDND
ncbi:type II secretion system secretin GspD [candidate division CSSED10-310 bacterium]|uniref:Type II secretion system secretin GspD n=1 Tax=candidate division CSSED10-310 bacterium TaxID=2855610 RepID=A0ABV6Z4C3_UNCC1